MKSKVTGRKENGDIIYTIKEGNSKCMAFVDNNNNRNYIYLIISKQKGDMEKMLNYLVEKTTYNDLWFLSPLNKKDKKFLKEFFDVKMPNKGIKNVLNNYYEAKVRYKNKKCKVLICRWKK